MKRNWSFLAGIILMLLPTLASSKPIYGGETDKGIRRDHNEDSYIILPDNDVYVVADGMGGHAAGEVASAIAVKAMDIAVKIPMFGALDRVWPTSRTAIMTAGYHLANSLIIHDSLTNAAHRGMGTTMVSAVVRGKKVDIINVGDSRAYILRGDGIRQISKDQSLLQSFIDAGKLTTPEEIELFPYKNVITQALGTQEEIVPDIYTEEVLPGDIILLCSDGLTNEVSDEEIRQIIRSKGDDLNGAANALIKTANEHGGKDNITAVMIKF